MEWVLVIVLAALGILFFVARRRAATEKELQSARELQLVRKVADEDVTRFGEELQDLHIETLTTDLDPAMRQDYQRALDAYENAKALLHDATVPDDVTEATKALEDGRYAMACVLARQAGEPLPERRPPCFFNPAHGPAQTDAQWAPPGGIPREVPVCLADADRLTQGADPDSRMVRSGNRMVPWFQGGPTYGAYAQGYYGSWAMSGLFPAFILGSMMGGGWGDSGWGGDSGGDSGGESGGDSGGDSGGGGDYGGEAGGGFDGGFDAGGGFDGGGF
jgi:hypothetical protein